MVEIQPLNKKLLRSSTVRKWFKQVNKLLKGVNMADKLYFKVKIIEHLRVRPEYKSKLLTKVLQGFYPGAITPNYIVMTKYAQQAMKELIADGLVLYMPKKPLQLSAKIKLEELT